MEIDVGVGVGVWLGLRCVGRKAPPSPRVGRDVKRGVRSN